MLAVGVGLVVLGWPRAGRRQDWVRWLYIAAGIVLTANGAFRSLVR
jgi:hypothetical protein